MIFISFPVEKIFVLRQILEKMKEFWISIHLLLMNFKIVYDSTDCEPGMNYIFQRN